MSRHCKGHSRGFQTFAALPARRSIACSESANIFQKYVFQAKALTGAGAYLPGHGQSGRCRSRSRRDSRPSCGALPCQPMEEKMRSISRPGAIAAAIAISLAATAAHADDDDIIRWKNIVGVITEKNVSNMVANIDSGTFAWSVRSGHARVDLMTGHAAFEVEGLSINGAQFSGTPGPITDVMGTLVCNAVDATQNTPGTSNIANTASVSLNAQGDAEFSGTIQNIPHPCNNPLFLVRVAAPQASGAVGRWIATGTERTIGD